MYKRNSKYKKRRLASFNVVFIITKYSMELPHLFYDVQKCNMAVNNWLTPCHNTPPPIIPDTWYRKRDSSPPAVTAPLQTWHPTDRL